MAWDAPITHIIDYAGLPVDRGVKVVGTCVETGLKVAQWKPISGRPEAFKMLNRRLMSTFKCVTRLDQWATKTAKCFHFWTQAKAISKTERRRVDFCENGCLCLAEITAWWKPLNLTAKSHRYGIAVAQMEADAHTHMRTVSKKRHQLPTDLKQLYNATVCICHVWLNNGRVSQTE